MSIPEIPATPPSTPALAQSTTTQDASASLAQGHTYGDEPETQQYTGALRQSTPNNKPPRKQLWIGLGAGFATGVLVSVLAVGVVSALGSVTESHALQKAVEDCGATETIGVAVVDNGAGLTIDTKGEDDSTGASMVDTACILKSLEVPESVIAQMDATTAMQGRQTAAWENVEASWTYHPDTGVKVIITNAK